MSTHLTLPVEDLQRAADYYTALLGVPTRDAGPNRLSLTVEAAKLELELVASTPEAVLADLDAGTLTDATDVLWRVTGGWSSVPGRGTVCCTLPTSRDATPPAGPPARIGEAAIADAERIVEDAAMSAARAASVPGLDDDAGAVLESAASRRVRVAWSTLTSTGVRIGFADPELPALMLAGARQAPPSRWIPRAIQWTDLAVEVRFEKGRRALTVACDRVLLA